jgi:hypothetical protein
MIPVFVRDENRIEARRVDPDALKPLGDLPRAEPAVNQDPALTRGNQRAIPAAATAEYG